MVDVEWMAAVWMEKPAVSAILWDEIQIRWGNNPK
jgi:hypothetical protein